MLIPAMSEPQPIFSLAGQTVTAQRGRLEADIIGAAQCISAWEKVGLSIYPNRFELIQIKSSQIQDLFVAILHEKVLIGVCIISIVRVTYIGVLKDDMPYKQRIPP
jgi:hypothetical protein